MGSITKVEIGPQEMSSWLTQDEGVSTTATPLQGSPHYDELAWLIPIAIGGTAVLVAIGLILFYCIRAIELRVAPCCYECFGCCDPWEGKYREIKEESVRLRVTNTELGGQDNRQGYGTYQEV